MGSYIFINIEIFQKKLNLLWSASADLVVFEGIISWIYQHIDPKTSTWGAWL